MMHSKYEHGHDYDHLNYFYHAASCHVLQVLTMEWVDGARLNDKAAIDAMGLDSSKFVDTLVQCSLRQMLENGFFHADPHAGNLLAMPSGTNRVAM